MSRNYVPKATVGSLFLASAASLLDTGDAPTFEAPVTRANEPGPSQSDNSPDWQAPDGRLSVRFLGTSLVCSRSAWTSKLWDANDENNEVDVEWQNEFLLDELTGFTVNPAFAMISRNVLRQPDEQTCMEYWEVERTIIRQWKSVEDDLVNLDSIFMSVSLGNECFEVARESHIISMAKNETNWFESALTWKNCRFRRVYSERPLSQQDDVPPALVSSVTLTIPGVPQPSSGDEAESDKPRNVGETAAGWKLNN